MKKIIISSILTLAAFNVFAETEINTYTKSWKSIPITVDANKNTYSTSKGFLMPEGNYYYTYSGYRCLNDKSKITGINPVMLNPDAANGSVIYCYPDK